LLDPKLADHIAAALDAEVVRVEREGLSHVQPARFILVGTYNSNEGEVNNHLKSRIGLIVESATETASDDLIEIIDRAIQFEKDPRSFVEEYSLEIAALKAAITRARA